METFVEFKDRCCDECYDHIIEASEYKGREVKLNDPMRSSDGKKKFYVYVKNDKGNVIKLGFGDPNMEIKRDDPKRRKSFRARHKCDNPGPKWKARYWSSYQWRADATVDEGVKQDPDIKDRKGTQPSKYYAGDLSKSTKLARARHFEKKKKGKAPGDATATTKPSKHTIKYKQMFGEAIEGLKNKSKESGISYTILKKVYDRGMAAYKTGHRPGTTAQQWAMARVNSFITKGKGTWGGADKDLASEVKE